MNGTGAILVLSALVSLPAFADEPAPSPTPAAATHAPAKKNSAKRPASKPAAGASDMTVTKDAETGELRPATPAEREKLLGRRPLVAPERKVVTLPDGSVMVELGEADRSYAVATKNADGSLSHACVHGAAEARNAVTAVPPPAPTAAAPAPATDR